MNNNSDNNGNGIAIVGWIFMIATGVVVLYLVYLLIVKLAKFAKGGREKAYIVWSLLSIPVISFVYIACGEDLLYRNPSLFLPLHVAMMVVCLGFLIVGIYVRAGLYNAKGGLNSQNDKLVILLILLVLGCMISFAVFVDIAYVLQGRVPA